jgi:hypothetical protein
MSLSVALCGPREGPRRCRCWPSVTKRSSRHTRSGVAVQRRPRSVLEGRSNRPHSVRHSPRPQGGPWSTRLHRTAELLLDGAFMQLIALATLSDRWTDRAIRPTEVHPRRGPRSSALATSRPQRRCCAMGRGSKADRPVRTGLRLYAPALLCMCRASWEARLPTPAGGSSCVGSHRPAAPARGCTVRSSVRKTVRAAELRATNLRSRFFSRLLHVAPSQAVCRDMAS